MTATRSTKSPTISPLQKSSDVIQAANLCATHSTGQTALSNDDFNKIPFKCWWAIVGFLAAIAFFVSWGLALSSMH